MKKNEKYVRPARRNRWSKPWTLEDVAFEVRRASAFTEGRMPKYEELVALGAIALVGVIPKMGGYDVVAKAADLSRHSKYEEWGEERVIQALRPFVEKLGRFPTRDEVRDSGEVKLSHQMTYIGTRKLAGLMGAELKGATTHLGNDYEFWAAKHLRRLGFPVKKMPTMAPHDLLVGDVRVDVKVSRYKDLNKTSGYGYRGWSWSPNKSKNTALSCDVFMCIALSPEIEVSDIYYVPAIDAKTSSISVLDAGYESRRWGCYRNNLDPLGSPQKPYVFKKRGV